MSSNQEVHGELVPVGGGDTIPLVRASMVVGRRDSCDICLRFPNVSGLHCEIFFRDGFWFVRDLGSTNGIKINGQRTQLRVLRPNDEIAIAKRKYVIKYNLVAGKQHLLDEMLEEDVMNQPLLERAGLAHPPKRTRRSPSPYDKEDDDEDEDDDD